MIRVEGNEIEISGIFEVTYREMMRVLHAYRDYLYELRQETMISDFMIRGMIGEALRGEEPEEMPEEMSKENA